MKNRLQQLREAVEAKLPDIAVAMTLTAKALAERNIKEKGFGRVYSEHKVPAWFLHGKELNAQGTKFLADHGVQADGTQGDPKKKRRKKKGEPAPEPFSKLTNWKEFRGAQGLQTSHVDLSYSNKMFANMQPMPVQVEGYVYRSALGATNVEAQNKMNWNRDRYGDFIGKALGPDEIKILADTALAEVTNVVDQFKP